MNLADMKSHPRNSRTGTLLCDPCDSDARREAAITRIFERHNTRPDNTHHYLLPHDLTKSLQCHRIPHVPEDCFWERDQTRTCACACHHSDAQALVLYHRAGDVLPNPSGTDEVVIEALAIAQRERQAHDALPFHRSDMCWTTNHRPTQCQQHDCDCTCHAGETPFARMLRCHSGVSAMTVDEVETHIRVGNRIGHVMWVDMADGNAPTRMIMMPDGTMLSHNEVV